MGNKCMKDDGVGGGNALTSGPPSPLRAPRGDRRNAPSPQAPSTAWIGGAEDGGSISSTTTPGRAFYHTPKDLDASKQNNGGGGDGVADCEADGSEGLMRVRDYVASWTKAMYTSSVSDVSTATPSEELRLKNHSFTTGSLERGGRESGGSGSKEGAAATAAQRRISDSNGGRGSSQTEMDTAECHRLFQSMLRPVEEDIRVSLEAAGAAIDAVVTVLNYHVNLRARRATNELVKTGAREEWLLYSACGYFYLAVSHLGVPWRYYNADMLNEFSSYGGYTWARDGCLCRTCSALAASNNADSGGGKKIKKQACVADSEGGGRIDWMATLRGELFQTLSGDDLRVFEHFLEQLSNLYVYSEQGNYRNGIDLYNCAQRFRSLLNYTSGHRPLIDGAFSHSAPVLLASPSLDETVYTHHFIK